MQGEGSVANALSPSAPQITPPEAPSYEEGNFLAELRAHARRQEAIAALGALALDEPSLDALSAEAVRRAALALGADLVHLLERGRGGALEVRAEAGAEAGKFAPGEGAPAAHALATGDTVITADAARDDRLLARPGAMAAAVSVLVRGRAGTSGVLCAHWRAPRGFSNDEVHFVESVAHVLSSAFARGEAEERARAVQGRLALSERMAAIGTLAGGVAHELNNPLASVAANLAFAEERLAALAAGGAAGSADEVAEALRDAREGAERMRAIIRDLQTFSRGDDETPGVVRLEPVLDSCVAMAWSEIRHRARLVKELGELPPVRGAEGRLAQVFLNLILNAAQAIAVGAADRNEIRIGARVAADGRVCVEVRDTGAGIAAEHLPRIFDPFFTTKPLGTGTGLGLSICHGIVSALGGAIEVESAPGKGSTFRVLLPAAAPLAVPAPHGRPRVLVVDDDALVAAAVRRALASDHDVTVVSSGRAALGLLQAGQTFDAMVSDLLMPELTGMELHAEVTRLEPDLAARTLFMTGGAFTGPARDFAERMGERVLAKPFDVDALRAAVARHVRR
jgi:signal transduction histidine kinase